MNSRTLTAALTTGLLLSTAFQVIAVDTVEIQATRAFHMNSGNPDAGSRMLAGGWPDNPAWGIMRGMMAFDLSTIPQDAAGIASASLSIFTRKTGFSVTNPEGDPGDMTVKDVGNLEALPDFDIETADWNALDPPGGDVSGEPLSSLC